MRGHAGNSKEFTHRICSVRISDEQRDALSAFMRKHDVSESDAIRFAIELMLGKSQGEMHAVERVEVEL